MPTPTPPIFWRSPRLASDLPRDELEIADPPPVPGSPTESLLQTLMPAGFMAAAIIGVGLLTRQSNMLLFTIPTVLASAIAVLVNYRYQKRKYQEKMAERTTKYNKYLGECEKRLQEFRAKQQQILLKKNPEPEECLRWVGELDRNLWACAPDQADFLDLRLGLGKRPSTVTIKEPRLQNPWEPDAFVVAARSLAEKYSTVPGVPIWLSLRQVGVAGLAGPREKVLDVARALAIQLATHHSPDEVKIVAIYPEDEDKEWNWLRWLPHVWSDDRRLRYLANNEEDAHSLLVTLDELLNRRKNQLQEHQGNIPLSFPFYLVFFLAAPTIVENEPMLQRLQTEGPRLGAFSIFLQHRIKALPKDCQALIRVFPEERPYLRLTEPRVEISFAPDVASQELTDRFARAMAPIRLKRLASLDVPTAFSLLDLFNVRSVEDLDVHKHWAESQTDSRSLKVPIGMKAGNELLFLDLHERAHGPNGLVAGMVGAGKSELLQTLVASLAIHFHPHRLAFVLVDYKGGGMAEPFRELPHSLGIITNLQKGNLAARAITSFIVEAERRQQLFNQAGVNHIDAYQRLYYRGQVSEPLPYLVIIVDEFAEMKTEQPEVAKEFIRIARIGRALGFRLILAMQKPSGIVDGQIEANTRFRLCLRVAQTEDSQAMLKRSEAAYLAGTGRAYFQVGVNEIFELFQVAWSGAPYDPQGIEAGDSREIFEIALDGSRRSFDIPKKSEQVGLKEYTQLQKVVEHLADVAQSKCPELKQKPLEKLWLDPLPEQLMLENVRRLAGDKEGWNGHIWKEARRWLEPVVGLYDEPKKRRQDPLRINLGKEGHLALYGAPGYGTTTFVQTLVTSLALSHSPADVHIYLLDFGGRLLKMFERLPHVGGVVVADEAEKLSRFLRYLLREMNRRKELFASHNVQRLPAYREVAKEPLPAIVVILDNYANFVKAYEEEEETIAQIAREGGNLGVHLVLTASNSATIRFKVSSNITIAAALYLVEQGEYGAIVGRTEGLVLPSVPGRGLIRAIPPSEFQTALPANGDTDAERNANLNALIGRMAAAWEGKLRATPIPMLPDVVPLSTLLPASGAWASPHGSGSNALSVPIGLDANDLTTFEIDLRRGPNFLIAGSVQSGKTTLLQTWLLALAERFPPNRLHFYLLDSRRMGLSPLAHLPHVKAFAHDQEQAEGVLSEIEQQLQERKQKTDESRRRIQTGGGFSEQAFLSQYPTLLLAMDDAFDSFDDITITSDELSKQRLKDRWARIVQQGRRLGFYLILAGSSRDLAENAWSEPIKSLKESQTGLLLGTVDDTIFNLRLPYSEMGKVLPLGQAYWIQRGQSRKIKIATAQAGSLMLSDWVESLAKCYKSPSPGVS